MSPPEERFRRLFRQNYTSLMAYAIRRTEQHADAEDAVAEAFAVAWRRIGDVPRDEHEQRLWLYGVARRTLANRRRASRRADRLSLRLVSSMDEAPAADSGIEDRVDTEVALWALAQLPERDQELVRLALWEELSHSDIATVVETSVPNVAVRLHRARQRLKRLFEDQMQGRPRDGHASNREAIGSRDGQRLRGADG